LVAARFSYMERLYQLLNRSNAIDKFTDFMMDNGFCPYCNLTESGISTVRVMAPDSRKPERLEWVISLSQGSELTRSRFGYSMTGLAPTRRWECKKHLERHHPEILAELLNGIIRPAEIDSAIAPTEAQLEAMAQLESRALLVQIGSEYDGVTLEEMAAIEAAALRVGMRL
jgi:hypothetical protein